MKEKIKLITFDLDDTLWDNRPTIINAEVFTRKWIEDKVGVINWGDFNDFLSLRDDLIKKDKSIAWDISKLRKEIFKIKLSHIKPDAFKNKIVDKAFKIFLSKRHEVSFFDGVEESIKELSKRLSFKNNISVLSLFMISSRCWWLMSTKALSGRTFGRLRPISP